MADERARVLLLDDDDSVATALSRVLSRAGCAVVQASDGEAALERLGSADFDVAVGTAAAAVDLGAMKYLMKPFAPDALFDAVTQGAKLCRFARAKRAALEFFGTASGEGSDRTGLEASFERALESLWIALQPIVSATDRSLFGYEALMRTSEPTLPHPGAVLDAAERLGKLERLGRTVRDRAAQPLADAIAQWLLFLNLHPRDLAEDSLLDAESDLGKIAERVILEVTERSSVDDIPDAKERMLRLHQFGYRIAIDDLGAGYAGLSSFVQLEPDFVKLDLSLVRDVDRNSTKRRLVRGLTDLRRNMRLDVVAEGVETSLIELGCDLLQGFRFAKPAPPFPLPAW